MRTRTEQAAAEILIEKIRPHYEGFLDAIAEETARTWTAGRLDENKRWLVRRLDRLVAVYCVWEQMRVSIGYRGPEDEEYLLATVDCALEKETDKRMVATLRHAGRRPVDDARLLELTEGYITKESDRRVFLAVCQHLAKQFLLPPHAPAR